LIQGQSWRIVDKCLSDTRYRLTIPSDRITISAIFVKITSAWSAWRRIDYTRLLQVECKVQDITLFPVIAISRFLSALLCSFPQWHGWERRVNARAVAPFRQGPIRLHCLNSFLHIILDSALSTTIDRLLTTYCKSAFTPYCRASRPRCTGNHSTIDYSSQWIRTT
jgi:hypothetical protein